jgi:hypothetical protein
MLKILLLLLPLLLGCYTNPQKRMALAQKEHEELQKQLGKISRLDSIICKTALDFKLPSCFLGQELCTNLSTDFIRSVESCSNCKMTDSSFLKGKEYYSLNVELRQAKGKPLQLFIGFVFVSAAPDVHGLGIIYDMVKSKDSLQVNRGAVPKQWME